MRTRSTPAPTRSRRPPERRRSPTSPTTRSRSSARPTTAPDAIVATVGPDSAGPLNVPVGHDDDIVCVSTNVREGATLELKKDLSPDNDPGRFNLLIKQGATSIDTENNAGDGGTTGPNAVNTGTYQVSETGGTSPVTDLADYQKSIVCKDDNGTGSIVAQTGPDSAGPLDVTVGFNDDIVCVSLNVRETGKIELKKDLSPDNDPGLFDLAIKQGATTSTPRTTPPTAATTGENTGQHRHLQRLRGRPAPAPTWPTTRSRSSARTKTAPDRRSPRSAPTTPARSMSLSATTTTSSASRSTSARPARSS